jgi:hypothetical protein
LATRRRTPTSSPPLADTLQTGAEFLIDADDSVANAELIDEVYLRAGLSPRG